MLAPVIAVAGDVVAGLRFYSRWPVPVGRWERDPHAVPDFARLAQVVPVVGLLLAAVPALVLWLADLAGTGPRLAAACCIAVVVASTGAFHEDGLADTADSFGASTTERRLEVMRDSRIGTFGAAALVLSLLVRVEALALLVGRDSVLVAVGAVLVAGAVTRTPALLMSAVLPPARTDGMAYALGLPGRTHVAMAAGLALALAVGLGLLTGLPAVGLAVGLVLAALLGWAAVGFARRHVGGGTGDIAGACQQLVEIALLLSLVCALS